MKIICLGTGTMGSTTRGNQSILVDSNILFDCGSGVVKKLEQMKLYTKSIRYLLITHCHADHFVDLPGFLIGRSIRREDKETLKIICGKGMREKTIALFNLCSGDGQGHKYDDFEEKYNVEFIELGNEEKFEDENIKITAYDLVHGTCEPILGFTLEKAGKTLGYATDTTLCDNVKKICQKSEIVFLDSSNVTPTRSHMGLGEVVELANQYHNTKVYAIHRNDYAHENIKEVEFPEDEDVIEL